MKVHPSHNFQAALLGGESCVRCGCLIFNLAEDGLSERAQQECPGRTQSEERAFMSREYRHAGERFE